MKPKKATPIKRELGKIAEEFDSTEADNIKYLIRYSEKRYIIFVDSENDLDWEVKNDDDMKSESVQSILKKINILIHNPAVMQLTKEMKVHYMGLLGEALAAVLEGESDNPDELLSEAENYLKGRECEITRLWIVKDSLIICLIALIIYIGVNCIAIGKSGDLVQYSLALFWGLIGGMASLLQHAGRIQYTCGAGKKLIWYEVLSRLFISMISAVIVLKAYDVGLVFASFKETAQSESVQVLLCIVAGFSERFAPSLVEKIEGEKEEETKDE
ncbi:MAG: hypothetical protein PUC12_14000 [Clostridiales bacterium]|nr:hypothetical protein [Clostridiales bacterium]